MYNYPCGLYVVVCGNGEKFACNKTTHAYSSRRITPPILILGARWSGWSQQRPKHLNPGKEPGTHPTGGCVGSNAGLNGC